MTIEKARYWAENMTELSKNDRLWLNNPVIMQGVGLAPMVVAATSGYTALVLAVAVAVMLTPARVAGAVLAANPGRRRKEDHSAWARVRRHAPEYSGWAARFEAFSRQWEDVRLGLARGVDELEARRVQAMAADFLA